LNLEKRLNYLTERNPPITLIDQSVIFRVVCALKKILVINGNPKIESFSKAMANSYAKAAKSAGWDVELFHIDGLDFDPNLHLGRDGEQPLEPDLIKVRDAITHANHIVFAYPIWWGVVPALMKGLIDRVFLPGFAFRFEEGDKLPVQLLKGRTARLLVGMDTPPWFYKLRYGAPCHKMMKGPVLGFSGIKPTKISEFGPMYSSTPKKRQKWLSSIEYLGQKGL